MPETIKVELVFCLNAQNSRDTRLNILHSSQATVFLIIIQLMEYLRITIFVVPETIFERMEYISTYDNKNKCPSEQSKSR